MPINLLTKLPFCNCGCKKQVNKKKNRFIHGHNSRLLRSRRIKKICLNCGEPFEVFERYIKQGWGKYCSAKCYHSYAKGKPAPWLRGISHPAWNKNLTKETDERVAKLATKMAKTKRRLYDSGELKPWNKNLTKGTDERVRKMIENMSKSLVEGYSSGRIIVWNKERKGIHLSPESEWKKGHLPWNTGLTKGEAPQLSNSGMRSEKFTDKTKQKIRDARLKQVIPIHDTCIEKTIHSALNNKGIKYKKHARLLGKYQVDIFIPPNIIVECDGDYWHNYPNGTENDRIRDKELIEAGYVVLRLWQHDIQNNIEWCTSQILRTIRNC